MNALQVLNILGVVIPQITNIVTHYMDLQNDPALTETDREKMKANLANLQLPDWDEIPPAA